MQLNLGLQTPTALDAGAGACWQSKNMQTLEEAKAQRAH